MPNVTLTVKVGLLKGKRPAADRAKFLREAIQTAVCRLSDNLPSIQTVDTVVTKVVEDEENPSAHIFSSSSIRYFEASGGDRAYYLFDCAMKSTCGRVFNDCYSNHEVETKLRKAGVIKTSNRTDTESSALVVIFSTKKAGEAFIERLNRYLWENSPAIS